MVTPLFPRTPRLQPWEVQKFYRLSRGLNWYDDEQLPKEKRDYVEKQLLLNDNKVDVVLSHTCPETKQPFDIFLSFIDQSTVDKSTEEWLERIENTITYKHWFYGHFHADRQDWEKGRMLFNDVIEFPKE